jgi:predicted outer membrane repeat protein
MSRIVLATRWFFPLVAVLAVVALFGAQPALAAGVVGNGTPASCTETALDNALNGGGIVTFNCGANPKTITLTFTKNISANTKLNGGNKIILKAPNTQHFQVFGGVTFKISNIILKNGLSNSGGAIENFGTTKAISVTFSNNHSLSHGGAINNYETLVVKSSTFKNNQSDQEGGAIFNTGGTVTVKSSTFTGNKANNAKSGGAIENDAGSLIVVSSTFTGNQGFNGGAILNLDIANVSASTFTGNIVSNGGGAIMNLNGTLTLTTSTLDSNQAVYGGGLVLYGSNNSITRSTFSNNTSSGSGGGIYGDSDTTYTNITLSSNHVTGNGQGGGGLYQYYGNATLNFSTVANNTASFGAGVNKDGSAPGYLQVQDTVLSKNSGGNCAGIVASLGHNLSSDTYCGDFTNTGDMTHKNAQLGALASNGGPTKTHLPLSGSPLISKGVAIGGITTDQRGVSRPQGGGVDIGSVEIP